LPVSAQPTTWDNFRLTRADLDHLFSRFLEGETPLTIRELALSLIDYRLKDAEDTLRHQIKKAELFQPRHTYMVGQQLVFPAQAFAMGKVVAERAGNNPEHGPFTVIEVEFESGKRREYASAITTPHRLNNDDGIETYLRQRRPSVESIFEDYGEAIMEEIEAGLVEEADAVSISNTWFLRSLLAEVNVGHLHLAEAVIDLAGGAPLPTVEILEQVDIAPNIPAALREFSLSVALAQDERFDNVGAVGHARWFLRRLAPPEVNRIPPRLEYQPEPYNPASLTDELRMLEAELTDEYSPAPAPEGVVTDVTSYLIYPHRRTGSLGLSAALAKLLPVSEESPRILLTMIDGQTNQPFPVWVLRDAKYLYGLSDFYRRNRLPVGGSVSIRKTNEPLSFVINFKAHKARTEYIRLAIPKEGKLRFDNFKRSIGADYDELLILGAEDIDGVDEVWSQMRSRRRKLVEIMIDLIPELGRLNPQNAVHAKTLYSAVNVLRRCPPGPIFAALATRPEFSHVGGPYWRLSEG